LNSRATGGMPPTAAQPYRYGRCRQQKGLEAFAPRRRAVRGTRAWKSPISCASSRPPSTIRVADADGIPPAAHSDNPDKAASSGFRAVLGIRLRPQQAGTFGPTTRKNTSRTGSAVTRTGLDRLGTCAFSRGWKFSGARIDGAAEDDGDLARSGDVALGDRRWIPNSVRQGFDSGGRRRSSADWRVSKACRASVENGWGQ